MLQSTEIDVYGRLINRIARTPRLALVIARLIEYFSARGILYDGNIHFFRVSEQARPNTVNIVDGAGFARLIGNGDMFFICRYLRGGRILHEIIGTERGDIIAVKSADNPRRIGVRHQLIFRIFSGVDFIDVGVVIFFVKYGRFFPISEEREHGNIQVYVRSARRFKSDKPFYIHAIFKRIGDIFLILFGEDDFYRNGSGTSRRHGHGIAALLPVLNGRNGRLCSGKQISVLRHGTIAVAGINFAHAFAHDDRVDVIGNGRLTDIMNIERHFIDAGAFFVVAELELGLIHGLAVLIICRKIGGRRCGFIDIDESCPLLSDRIREPVFIIDNIGRRHHELIHARRNFGIGKLSECAAVFHVLANESSGARLIGSSHGGTGQSVIVLSGNGRKDFAAVCRNFRFNPQIGGRSPRGEIGHKRSRDLFLADPKDSRTGSGQHFALFLGNGTHRTRIGADGHGNRTRNIVINDDTGCADLLQSHADFIFKVRGAALYKDDLSFIKFLGFYIIRGPSDAGNGDIFKVMARYTVSDSL